MKYVACGTPPGASPRVLFSCPKHNRGTPAARVRRTATGSFIRKGPSQSILNPAARPQSRLHSGTTLKMRRLVFLFVLAVYLCSAQDWARQTLEKSPRHREWVTVKHDGRSVETFVVYPESKTKTPVVLIIHEIFGLTDWVQDLADQVAAAGYIAVAPDLLSGMGPNGGRTPDYPQGGATQAVSHLNPDQVTADLKAVADYGLKLPSADGKLYVAGFCWGGGQSFRFATNRPDLAAAFVFMDRPLIKRPCHASRRRFMGFMPGTMPALAPPFRRR